MTRVSKHTFETAFANRLVKGPPDIFRSDSKLYNLLSDDTWTPFTAYVQCCSPRIAERLLRENQVDVMTERDFNSNYQNIDFRHIEIGKTLVLNKIKSRAPFWSDLREWMEDSLVGDVSAFLCNKETRLSFSDDADYMLARLAWG